MRLLALIVFIVIAIHGTMPSNAIAGPHTDKAAAQTIAPAFASDILDHIDAMADTIAELPPNELDNAVNIPDNPLDDCINALFWYTFATKINIADFATCKVNGRSFMVQLHRAVGKAATLALFRHCRFWTMTVFDQLRDLAEAAYAVVDNPKDRMSCVIGYCLAKERRDFISTFGNDQGLFDAVHQ